MQKPGEVHFNQAWYVEGKEKGLASKGREVQNEVWDFSDEEFGFLVERLSRIGE